MMFQIPACLELLESVPLPQAEQYAHELVTWLSGILENNFSDTKVINLFFVADVEEEQPFENNF